MCLPPPTVISKFQLNYKTNTLASGRRLEGPKLLAVAIVPMLNPLPTQPAGAGVYHIWICIYLENIAPHTGESLRPQTTQLMHCQKPFQWALPLEQSDLAHTTEFPKNSQGPQAPDMWQPASAYPVPPDEWPHISTSASHPHIATWTPPGAYGPRAGSYQ